MMASTSMTSTQMVSEMAAAMKITKAASTETAFHKLPVELNQQIALNLESDQDLLTFMLICPATYFAVEGGGLYLWRLRYRDFFDPVDAGLTNEELKDDYTWRRQVLRVGARFRIGSTENEMNCLGVILGLITEAFQFHQKSSLNMECVKRFVYNTNIIQDIFRPGPSRRTHKHPLLTTLQVVFAHWSFDLNLAPETYGFEISQKQVYTCARLAPLIDNSLEVNMEWVLHAINFFKYHFTRKVENTMYEAYASLPDSEKMKAWNCKLELGVKKLGNHWKGTYAFLLREEMARMRRTVPGTDIFMDHNIDLGEAGIQSLGITFPENARNVDWPPFFEHHLRSLRKPIPRRRRVPDPDLPEEDIIARSLPFDGEGYDEENFRASGWINPLPPQNGVSGWQRLTMMKYFIDNDGHFDLQALWAYEGVVLPGGQIIIGRWWSPFEGSQNSPNMYCGPFILWNVDDPARDQ